MSTLTRTTVLTAAVAAVMFSAGPAAASPPQPEGAVSAAPGTIIVPITVTEPAPQPAPAPAPAPARDQNVETIEIFVAAAAGAFVAGLVRRRSKRDRAEPREGGVIELSVPRGDR